MDSVLDPNKFVEGLADTTIGEGMHFIDGDTIVTDRGESIRLTNIDTPEVAHTDDFTGESDYHAAGTEYHEQVAKLAREYNFTQIQRTGNKDSYGRSVGDLINPETGERFNDFLVNQGVASPAVWADKANIDASIMGTGQDLAGREVDAVVDEAIQKTFEANGGSIDFKTLAVNESVYDEDQHAGVSLRKLDRSLTNEAFRPMATSFDTALIGMGAALQGMKQMIGDVTGNEAMETAGQIGVAQRNERIAEKPTLLLDYTDVNSFSTGVQYLLNNAAMSAPYMANTMASAAAGAGAGAVAGSVIPGLGTAGGAIVGGIIGLTSPTAIYAGQTYNGQDEKNWKVALTSGLAQASLDRIGIKGLSISGKAYKEVLKEAEETLIKKGLTKAAARKKIEEATKMELMGYVKDADGIIRSQLGARGVTRTILNGAVKGMGSEAVTEAAQEALGHVGENWNEENLGLFDHGKFNSEFLNRIANATIAGGTLGGSFGSLGGVREVGQWADAAWDRGDSKYSFEDTLENLEDQNVTLAESMAKMERAEHDTTDIALRINQDAETRQAMTLTEKAVETIKNAPMLWRGMMRSRMQKDSLVRSHAYRTLGAVFAATLGKYRAGENYEESMHLTAQQYSNELGDALIWTQGLDGEANIHQDAKSRDKFNKIISRFDDDFNRWFEQNSDGKGNLNKGVTTADYDWAQWDQYASKGFNEVLSKDPTKNMVQQFHERRELVAAKMRARQNFWWNKNAKTITDPDGTKHKEVLPEKIKKLNNYLGKYKKMKREMVGERRGSFEALLRSEYNLSKEAANDLTSRILDGEPLDGHDDSVFDLITKGIPQTSAKKRTLALSQHPKFTEYFEQDIFKNMREASRNAARFETYHKFVGRDNWRVASLLDQAAKEGVPAKEVNMMALSIQHYLEAQSGNYKRPPKGSYGERALGVQRKLLLWSVLTALPMSMFSSTVELSLTTQGLTQKQIFGEINAIAHEAASGVGKYLSRMPQIATGKEFLPESPFYKRLNQLGYLNWEAGAATTVGATETSDWGKYFVDRFFKYNGLEDLTNMTRTMRLAFMNEFLTDHIDTIKTADPKTEGYRYANEQLRNLGLPVDRYIGLLDGQANGTLNERQKTELERLTMLAEYTFINQAVALPGTANRPLFYQDPRLAMFTQFNGYVATFSATILPRLWSEYVARGRPSMKYNTFALMGMMIFLGFISQYLKDWLKYGGSTPYLDSKEKMRRAVNSSGLLGQGERVLNFVWPQFENNNPTIVGKAADTVLDEMPAMGPVRRMMKAADSAYQGEGQQAKYNAIRAAPVLGPFTALAEKMSGLDLSEYQK